MKKFFILLFATLTILSGLTSSCLLRHHSSNKEARYGIRYGIEYNDVRDSLGIPRLPKDWIMVYEDSMFCDYRPIDEIPPCHVDKLVTLVDDNIILEKDTYTAGVYYINGSGDKLRKELSVIYFYVDPMSLVRDGIVYKEAEGRYRKYKKGFNYEYVYGGSDAFDPPVITKEQADSIMNSWGITYND